MPISKAQYRYADWHHWGHNFHVESSAQLECQLEDRCKSFRQQTSHRSQRLLLCPIRQV